MPDRRTRMAPAGGVLRLRRVLAVALATTLAWMWAPASFARAPAHTQAAPPAAGAVVKPGLLELGSGFHNPRVAARVRALQVELDAIGYPVGRIDGRLGERTEREVRRLQADYGLPADGIVGPHTLAALAAATAPSAPGPSPPSSPSASGAPPQAPPSVPSSRTVPGQRQRESAAQHARPPRSPTWPLILALPALACLLGAGWYAHRRFVVRAPEVRASPAGQADDGVAAFKLGVALEQHGSLASAEAAYRRADGRGHAAAASNLGVLLEERGDLAEAEAAYRRADERGDPHGAFNLGVLLEQRDDLSGAEAAYRRADGRGHAAAASNLGVLLEERGDLAETEAAYRRADERGDPHGAFNLGVLLEQQSDLSGAEAAYRRADERGDAEVAETARAALSELGRAVTTVGVDGTGETP